MQRAMALNRSNTLIAYKRNGSTLFSVCCFAVIGGNCRLECSADQAEAIPARIECFSVSGLVPSMIMLRHGIWMIGGPMVHAELAGMNSVSKIKHSFIQGASPRMVMVSCQGRHHDASPPTSLFYHHYYSSCWFCYWEKYGEEGNDGLQRRMVLWKVEWDALQLTCMPWWWLWWCRNEAHTPASLLLDHWVKKDEKKTFTWIPPVYSSRADADIVVAQLWKKVMWLDKDTLLLSRTRPKNYVKFGRGQL